MGHDNFEAYLLTVGIPYLVGGYILFIANIYTNSDLNYGWANGNFYLVANTIYMFIQYYLGIFLILEDDDYIRDLKLIRMVLFTSAVIWNACYFCF